VDSAQYLVMAFLSVFGLDLWQLSIFRFCSFELLTSHS
jgi:hypothetical protein